MISNSQRLPTRRRSPPNSRLQQYHFNPPALHRNKTVPTTSTHNVPMSAPMNIFPANGMRYPSPRESDKSYYSSSVMSHEGYMDATTIDPRTNALTSASSNETDFPNYSFTSAFDFSDTFMNSMTPLTPMSPMITGNGNDNTPTALDSFDGSFDSLLPGPADELYANTYAAPWNPNRLNVTNTFKANCGSLPNNFNGFNFDSVYGSGTTAHDAMSFISAPTEAMCSYNNDELEGRPSKKIKKIFRCDLPGEHRTRGFANIHDLERHQNSTHGIKPKHSQSRHYRCCERGCASKAKIWDRKDNFRSHVVRKHFHSRADQSNKPAIDMIVMRSQLNLSQTEIDRVFDKKQKQKQASRLSAGRRKARKSSGRLDLEAAARLRTNLGTVSGNPSAVTSASAIDDSEYSFGDSLFDPNDLANFSPDPDALTSMTPTSYPIQMNMTMHGMGDHLNPQTLPGDHLNPQTLPGADLNPQALADADVARDLW